MVSLIRRNLCFYNHKNYNFSILNRAESVDKSDVY